MVVTLWLLLETLKQVNLITCGFESKFCFYFSWCLAILLIRSKVS